MFWLKKKLGSVRKAKFEFRIEFERDVLVCTTYYGIKLTIVAKVKVVVALPTNVEMYLAQENGLHMNSRYKKGNQLTVNNMQNTLPEVMLSIENCSTLRLKLMIWKMK